jgi:SAM-dependent methyltransferase
VSYSPEEIREEVDGIRRAYADAWWPNAAEHLKAGDYDWMAGFLPPGGRILEIGTGVGIGTAILAKRGYQVISLDLNPFCLDEAEKTLQCAGINFSRHRRTVVFKAYPNAYDIEYGEITLAPQNLPPVLLFESDTLKDSLIVDWLANTGPFDATILWCVGAHGCRAGASLEDVRKFRVNVRGSSWLMADRLLRAGGVMHTVERMLALHDYAAHLDSFRADIRADLRSTSLVLTDLQIREIDTVQGVGGVHMNHDHADGQKAGKFALKSALLKKA